MSVIEDSRKLIQDFLAPELREIATRLDALEKHFGIRLDALEARTADRFKIVDGRFDALEMHTNSRFDAVDKRFDAMDKRFDTAERLATERHAQILQSLASLADVYQLKERMARIDAREKAS